MKSAPQWVWLAAVGCVLVAAGCGGAPSAPVDPLLESELASLAGTWVYERNVTAGYEVPIDKIRNCSIVISGDSLERHAVLPDGEVLTMRSKIVLIPTADPKQMDDVLDLGRRRVGIYKLEDGKLYLCYDDSGKDRPTTFESREGTPVRLTVLRRASDR